MKKLIAVIFICILLVSGTPSIMAQPLSNNQYAIDKLEKDVKKHKNDMSLYLSLCLLYYKDKQYDNMLSKMHKINKRFKPNSTVLTAFSRYSLDFYNAGQYELAEQVARLTTSRYRDDPDTAILYSQALVKINKINDAISYLERYLKRNPLEMILYDKLIDLYIYKEDYISAFRTARMIQDKKMSSIYFYFLEALILLNDDRDKALQYLKAYLEKLSIASDYEPRIKAAQKLYNVLSNSTSDANDYIKLIKYSEKLNAPASYVLIEARFAAKQFPETTYFADKVTEISKDIGIQ